MSVKATFHYHKARIIWKEKGKAAWDHSDQALLKKDIMLPCLGSFAFPAFLFPALPLGLDGAVLPAAGDFLAAAGLYQQFNQLGHTDALAISFPLK